MTLLHDEEMEEYSDHHHHYHHRKLPVLDGICYCPVNTTAFAPPAGAEYLQVLNTQLDVLATSGYLSIVGAAQATVQVKQVNCSTDLEPFSTIVSITVLRINETGSSIYNTSLTTDDVTFLEQAFSVTYNFLQQHYYCDPFVRTVDTVQLVQANPFRRHQRGLLPQQEEPVPTYNFTELVFQVTGHCRGCTPLNTTLFNVTASSRRRLVQDLASTTTTTLRDMTATTSDRLVDVRQLQQQQQQGNQTICYCPVSVIGDRAPTLAEFLIVFNQTIATLDKLVIRQAEEDKTLPPTYAPTSPPSPVV